MFKLGIPTVDTALDWVWLVDFGQGNLAIAQTEAEASILDRWNTSTLFARGVVHQLQGEYKQALSLFEEAFIATSNIQKKYTFAAVAHFAELQAREILPDGCLVMVESNQTESLWKKRCNQLKSALQSEEAFQVLDELQIPSESENSLEEEKISATNSSSLSSSLSTEGDFIDFVAQTIPTWRTILGRAGDQSQKEDYLAEIEQQFTHSLESYQNLDIFTIAKSLYSVLAELLALTGKVQEGWSILDNLIKAHKKHKKYLETGWYLLCQGDLLISLPSLGKPIVFGYCLNIMSESWAEKSLDHSSLDCAAAQQIYLEARQYFIAAHARRGEGMATLRLAYLNGIAEQWNLAHYGYEEAVTCFKAVGDRLNAMAAEMGKFWSCLHYRDLDDKILARASQLAITAKRNGAIAQGVGWGLVFARAAQEAFKQQHNEEVSLNLACLAETILSVFTESRELLPWHLFQQILLTYDSIMQGLYTNLADIFARQNNWSKAFNLAEMANIYTLRKAIGPVSQHNITTLEIEQIPNYLPSHTLVISYLLTETQLLAWAINSEGEIQYSQVNELAGRSFSAQTLLETTQDWLNRLVKKKRITTISRILESTFFSSFDREIARANYIVIVPCAELSHFPFTTLLWRTQPLGKQKSLAYLSAVSQLAYFNSHPSTTIQEALFIVYPEAIWQQKIHLNSFSSLQPPSILSGVAKMMADLYDTQPLVGNLVTRDEIFANINRQPRIIHFFIQETTFSNLDLNQLELRGNIVVLTLANLKLGQLANSQLTGIAQSLIYAGAKTVLINRYPLTKFKDVATSILLLYFHLGLCAGHSVAESFWQAQQQLELVTVAEALNFCHTVQSCIPWHKDSDRANRALLTRYMGDILFFGRDYVRAVEAYEVARKIFYSVGYPEQAKVFEKKYQQTIKLAQTNSKFMPEKLMFNSPALRGMYQIVGDWQQYYGNN